MTDVSQIQKNVRQGLSQARTGDRTPAFRVRHHISGGLEHGGGIGRLVGYICGARAVHGDIEHVVTDTRGGPRVTLGTLPAFAGAMARIALDQLQGDRVLQHLHIAGRGSTVRKTVLGLWASLLGAPYVLHLHDYDYARDLSRRSRWQFDLIRRLFRNARHVIVLGGRDKRTVTGALEVPPSRVTILRNCVPSPGPRPERKAVLAPVRLLFLGQLGPRKGVPELLAALAHPDLQAARWHATLAGDGAVEAYRAEAEALGLADRIDFPGWVGAQTAASLRAEADILVLPSHAEGFAMAVLEGMAAGLAVVTTRVGAHDEVLEHDVSCLFVTPGDDEDLARSLARLVSDADLRARLGRAGAKLFDQQFRIEGYVERLSDLQHAVMAPSHNVEVAT